MNLGGRTYLRDARRRFLHRGLPFIHSRNMNQTIRSNPAKQCREMRAVPYLIFPLVVFVDPTLIFNFGRVVVNIFVVLRQLNATVQNGNLDPFITGKAGISQSVNSTQRFIVPLKPL